MNISLEKTDAVSAVLTVNIDKADYEGKVNASLKNYSKKAQMPGFRPGHVPVGLVRKMYGVQAKQEEINKLTSEGIYNYIKENKVNMLGEPMPSEKQTEQDLEGQDDFTFAFDIAIAPEFSIALGGDDKIAYYDIAVSDEAVNARIEQMRSQGGHAEPAQEYADRDVVRGILAELDESGNVLEGGLTVEKASVMPAYFKSDDEKKHFEGVKTNTVITFNPAKAYAGSDAEVASLLHIDKSEVAAHSGNFSFQIEEISRFVPAALTQEFFDQVFGEGAVKSEEEFRARVKSQMSEAHTADSDYKFLLDVRAHCEAKVGALTFPDALLKRFMKLRNADKGDEFVEKNYEASIKQLEWHLIKEQLVEAEGIKIEDADVKASAIEAARFQFAQYGMNNIPDEYLEQYAAEMLKKEDQANGLVERAIDKKLTAALKTKVTLEHKEISEADFGKLFEENKAE